MNRSAQLALPAAILAAAVALAACGGAAAPTQAPPPTPNPAPEVVVTGTEFAFDPEVVRVKAGAAKITLKNGGVVEHDFKVDALNIQVHAGPGKTTSETYQGLQSGTYEVYCSIPGHKQAGMVGQLIVE